ncbi:MAG: DUF975 domain-containing protein [Cyanobacteria bacterium P01_G01_bin.67]
MKPLSVGNVVSAGLRIYRDNFKKYYRLAFIGSLWAWIPIYGTAKFYAHQALISRLAYGEIIEKPESIRDANRHVKGRMWSFLVAALLVSLRFLLAYILGAIAIALVVGGLTTVISMVLSSVLGDGGAIIGTIISLLLSIAVFVLFFGYLIRLFASFSVSELLLSTEENINASQSLKKSQELTKGYLKNLIIIYFISSLVSFPLLGLIFTLQVLPAFFQNSDLAAYSGIFTIFQLIFNSLTTALILPFWQSIKAVIYYDLKVRREGMGLDLNK